jgi:hypothetical protein
VYTIKEFVKYDLGISGTTYDAQLDIFIRSVTAYINLQIFGEPGLTLEATDYEEVHDILEVPRNNHIFLKHKPINIAEETPLVITLGSDVLSEDEYHLYQREGKIVLQTWVVGRKILTVEYNAGYLIDWDNLDDLDKHNLPWDLEELARILVIERWNSRSRGENIKSESIGSWSRTFKSVSEKTGGYTDNILVAYRDDAI